MSDLHKAASAALEALEGVLDTYGEPLDLLSISGGAYEALQCRDAITALRAALAEPVPTVAENATTQQQLEEAPPSEYRRGYWDGFAIGKREGRIEAEDALAEPVQEPVAWMIYTEGGTSAYVTDNPNDLVGAYRALALYTAPPKRQAEPVQEPVAWILDAAWGKSVSLERPNFGLATWKAPEPKLVPLYTQPPQRKPLTEEEILSVLRLAPPEPSLWPHLKDEAVVGDVQKAVLAIARAIERAHGIGGNDE